jgi:hypothetical protein
LILFFSIAILSPFFISNLFRVSPFPFLQFLSPHLVSPISCKIVAKSWWRVFEWREGVEYPERKERLLCTSQIEVSHADQQHTKGMMQLMIRKKSIGCLEGSWRFLNTGRVLCWMHWEDETF